MFSQVFKGLILALGMVPQQATAVPEAELQKRWPDIATYFASHVKTGEFKGAGGATLSYAYVEGDPRLPPVVVSVGLGESYIHYKEIIYDLMATGDFRQAFYVFDLRSQGFSQKLAPDPNLFHIDSFSDYVGDLEIFFDQVVRPKYPLPARVMAHSTGGLIAFNLLARRPELAENIIFVAPLFGLNYGGAPEWFMRILASGLSVFGFKNKDIPFSGGGVRNFATNKLTYSEGRYEILESLKGLLPTKAYGRPSVGFIVASQAALKTSFALAEKFSTPAVMLTADEDAYVVTSESERYCKAMQSCDYVPFKRARHVLLVERDEVRDQVMARLRSVLVVNQEETP